MARSQKHQVFRDTPATSTLEATAERAQIMTSSTRKSVKEQAAEGILVEDAADESERVVELTRRAVVEGATIDNLIEDAAYDDGYDGWPISGKALAVLRDEDDLEY